ncbi:hypothetical protein BD324DRAFT_648295 [Kockovaella imperatae]|uniref:Cytochrome c oxidase assembly protein n=1 Tax=Kockovaella imperatae TaxID=4999 RepID=A0A1Y1UNN7_9TREE|nr:hypothetical protein BD324DRAFT_648295 [Kockovaella imperatae]ORX39660.1 hypothetical protein BD324DRAFT_648295 [Kockovaella imperatae]
MSLGSKIFLGGSLLGSVAVVWGVHALQKREQDTMYQGVIKDDIRVRNKATAAAAAKLQAAAEGAIRIPPLAPLNTPGAPTQRPYDPTISSSSSSSSSSTFRPIRRFDEDDDRPLMGVGIAQPPPSVDEDCATCVISPPPQLVESQSKETRQKEREERLAEYEAQKKLAGRLQREQGLHDEPESGRLV